MLSNYYKPTPKVWRKVGDTGLFLCNALAAPVVASPLTATEKMWTIFALSIFGALFKTATNFFKLPEDPILPTENQNASSSK